MQFKVKTLLIEAMRLALLSTKDTPEVVTIIADQKIEIDPRAGTHYHTRVRESERLVRKLGRTALTRVLALPNIHTKEFEEIARKVDVMFNCRGCAWNINGRTHCGNKLCPSCFIRRWILFKDRIQTVVRKLRADGDVDNYTVFHLQLQDRLDTSRMSASSSVYVSDRLSSQVMSVINGLGGSLFLAKTPGWKVTGEGIHAVVALTFIIEKSVVDAATISIQGIRDIAGYMPAPPVTAKCNRASIAKLVSTCIEFPIQIFSEAICSPEMLLTLVDASGITKSFTKAAKGYR